MTEIKKNKIIEGRPYFTSDNKAKKAKGSFLQKNSLFKKLDPLHSPGKIDAAFRKLIKWLAPYFSIQKPNAVKSNITQVVRPKDSIENVFTLGNLWKHHRDFISKDRDCPKSVIKAFEILEKEEKTLKKIKKDKDRQAYIDKKHREILNLPLGKTRLFLFQREPSLDHSHNAKTVCSITRTENGYTIQKMGQDATTVIPLAGKEKTFKNLRFTDVPSNDPHLKELISDWAGQASFNPNLFEAYQVDPLTPDNLITRSNRADQLFWQVIGTFSSPSKTGRVHLRTDLLTLFQVFRKERRNLDPSSQEYHDLKFLFEEVSAKVLIAYKKGSLSSDQLAEINEKLALIDTALQKAKQKPINTVASKVTLKKYQIKPELPIQAGEDIPEVLFEFEPVPKGMKLPQGAIDLSGLDPFALKREAIATSAEFMKELAKIHELTPSIKSKQNAQEIFRFFSELSFNFKDQDSFWWDLDENEITLSQTNIAEIAEAISTVRKAEVLTQYEFESLENMTTLMQFLYGKQTGVIDRSKEGPLKWKFSSFKNSSLNSTFVESDFEFKRFYQQADEFLYENRQNPLEGVPQFTRGIVKQDEMLKRYFSALNISIKDWRKKAEINNWIRPMGSQLTALYTEVCLRTWTEPKKVRFQFADGSTESSSKFVEGLFWKFFSSSSQTPEAFHSNPEGVLKSFLNKKNASTSNLVLTPDTIKALSRLLRVDSPHEELIAFMHEHSDLMQIPEIRNFFDALFFGSALMPLGGTVVNPVPFERVNIYPEGIASEIEHLQKAEKGKFKMDLCLYYIEMNLRLKEFYLMKGLPVDDFSNDEPLLRSLIDECRENPAFHSSKGYAARIFLRLQLSAPTIDAANGPEILKTFADVFSLPMDPWSRDPHFEGVMDRHWTVISQHLKEWNLTPEIYTDIIERFFYQKNMALDGSEWVKKGDLIFENAQFELDLNSWSIKQAGSTEIFCNLPAVIQNHPLIKASLPQEDLSQVQVLYNERESKVVYSFKDASGTAIQIEQEKNEIHLYKKITIEGEPTWLESLQPPEKDIGLKDIINLIRQKNEPSFPALLSHGIYVDPHKKRKGYVLNKEGKVDFELSLHHKKGNISIQSVVDCRGDKKTGPWKIGTGKNIKALSVLKNFEHPESMILFSKHGHLKKIEFPRYNLSFELENGKFKCITEPLEGYYIDLTASEKDKNGYHFALLLEHPDKEKPKKLLLPSPEAVKAKKVFVTPQAKGLLKLKLASSVLKGKVPSVTVKSHLEIASGGDSLEYTTIDIRRETNELVKKRKQWPEAAFVLIQHALVSSDPILAHQWYQRYPFKEAIKDQKLLQKMVLYCGKSPKSGAEAALKLKISLKLLNTLKQEKKLTTQLKLSLQKSALEAGKKQFAAGRRVPALLAMKEQEKIQFARIAEKQDPEYFREHLTVHFLKKGDSFTLSEPIDVDATKWQKKLTTWKVNRKETPKTIDFTPLDATEAMSRLPLTDSKVALLFTPQEINSLFISSLVDLPVLKLDNTGAKHTYERMALEEFQKDLDSYHKKAIQQETHILSTNPKSLNRFLRTKIVPKQIEYEQEMARCQLEIQNSLRDALEEPNKTAYFSGRERIPTFEELRIDLIQDRIDNPQLKAHLIGYYEAFVRKNALDSIQSLLSEIQSKKSLDPKTKEVMSNALYRLLTLERNYDPEQDVRLLIFEAQFFKNFKALDGGLHQLDLLNALTSNPYSIVQAPTGAGKTSVLSVLSSLLKANGKNLVIQKVLPSLYEQTHEQLHDVLEGVFDTQVMPLRFNLKMRLTTKETYFDNKEEKTKDTSIFKEMYESLAYVIENKACVLTDYTSLPLLEEKFFKLSNDMYESSLLGVSPTEIEEEHFEYLKKILLLLESKALENMDEFDQPNRPIQKLQLSFGKGAEVAKFLTKTTLKIYDLLLEEETLGLKQNIQGDITEEMRQECIQRVAAKMAEKLDPDLAPQLLEYFLGRNEDVLEHLLDPHLADQAALCKDQFTIYLPLTLSYNRGSRYSRSEDGSKTVPCRSGEKHDAKFGTILEQINYTIQDYIQGGVSAYDLKSWFQDYSEDFQNHEATQRKFAPLFDPYTVDEVVKMFKTSEGVDALLSQINEKGKANAFCKLRLNQLKMNGAVISMDPSNIIDMNFATSGISATTGAKESLHSQFVIEKEANASVRAEMAYRIFSRAETLEVMTYDPENPKELFQNVSDVSALIDGADAYKNNPEQAAKDLLESNPHLRGVEYVDSKDKSQWAGLPNAPLNQKGYVFKESKTVGTDIRLKDDAKAVLTLNAKHGMRDYSQKEGRLRKPAQTCILAQSHYSTAKTVPEVMSQAIYVDAGIDAKDIYRLCKQELHAIVRKEMKRKLLAANGSLEFLNLYKEKECRKLFTTGAEAGFEKPGDYFNARKPIDKNDTPPEDVLNALKAKCRAKAEALGLDVAVVRLDAIKYSQELLDKMLSHVSASKTELEMELQMEEENELENEMEQELALQLENQLEVEEINQPHRIDLMYPLRLESALTHKVYKKIHPAYNVSINVSDNFMPFSRDETDSSFKRRAFDSTMYRIGEVIIKPTTLQTVHFVIDDPLKDRNLRKDALLIYDIRSDKFIASRVKWPVEDCVKVYAREIAQIKFLDGRTDGYLPEQVEALKEWLEAEGSVRMKEHLLNDILRYRYRDKLRFKGSQLEEIFNSL